MRTDSWSVGVLLNEVYTLYAEAVALVHEG